MQILIASLFSRRRRRWITTFNTPLLDSNPTAITNPPVKPNDYGKFLWLGTSAGLSLIQFNIVYIIVTTDQANNANIVHIIRDAAGVVNLKFSK